MLALLNFWIIIFGIISTLVWVCKWIFPLLLWETSDLGLLDYLLYIPHTPPIPSRMWGSYLRYWIFPASKVCDLDSFRYEWEIWDTLIRQRLWKVILFSIWINSFKGFHDMHLTQRYSGVYVRVCVHFLVCMWVINCVHFHVAILYLEQSSSN